MLQKISFKNVGWKKIYSNFSDLHNSSVIIQVEEPARVWDLPKALRQCNLPEKRMQKFGWQSDQRTANIDIGRFWWRLHIIPCRLVTEINMTNKSSTHNS